MAAVVKTGLEVLRERGFDLLRGERIGLVVHPASVDRDLRHTVDVFLEADGVDVRRLFGPQHGIRGETQDNMIEWEGFKDPRTGLPVCSLYGKARRPAEETLEDLDTLVVDLQDVGTRCYTFIWTMLLCMRACAESGKRIVVLDRPNPIGGTRMEGPMLDPAYRSFVGLGPIPMRHGMTMGELAAFFNESLGVGVRLDVVRMEGWRRASWFEETGLPWVLPSPNMPTVDTAGVYPGFCLLEGTELSEGRGTTRPFEIFGAPFIDPYALAERLERHGLPGAVFRALYFQPTFQKWAGKPCGGAQVHVTDRELFEPVRAAVTVLSAVRESNPSDFSWKSPPYEYEEKKPPIDILAGSDVLRKDLESGKPPRDIALGWRKPLEEFARARERFLHYA
ncbi:MAG: DUF1343 domain-containing protein [Elusimicrobiota bacterium]